MDIAGATIAIEAEQPFFKVLENIATVIGCRVISKPECILFHAAVPYSQEFLVAVLNQGVKLWSNLGISEEQATPALLHLMKSIIQEIETDGMQRTGTIVFNDPDTVGEHVDAIKQVDESAADLYKQLTLRTMPFEHHQFKPDDELRMRVWLKSGKLLGK
jgi:predicted short-subunit dehydrogenase-like oxidoreductase (DUF2520 family)